VGAFTTSMTWRIGRSWTGIYPMSTDHKPIVGRHSENRVSSVLSGRGNGIQLSPAIGRIAADTILGRSATFSPSVDWSHGRFSAPPRSAESES